jgi:pantetheine-phosphate adenylyltransferase
LEKAVNKVFIYPGSFCPPTKGHLNIIKIFSEQYHQPLIVLCSENPEKTDNWFSPEQCKEMWKTYRLPSTVCVQTISEFKSKKYNTKDIVMIRGLRNADDASYEKEVMVYNKNNFNINQYLYIFGDTVFSNISSSRVRAKTSNFDFHDIYLDVSYGVITELWKKVLNIENIYMVVGRPGSGKTTVLTQLSQKHKNEIHYINTDNYNEVLKPKLRQYFQCEDLFEIAKKREDELIQVISKSWLDMLFNDLSTITKKIVLVEIAYGMQQHKNMFRFLGANVIQFWCQNNDLRNTNRNTDHLKFFIDKIPDYQQTEKICKENMLNLYNINTNDNDIEKSVKECEAITGLIHGNKQ